MSLRRFLSFLMAAVMLLSLLPAGKAKQESRVSARTRVEECIISD